MVEKLGHKKKIQMYRKEWIDEGKPKSTSYEEDNEDMNDFMVGGAEQPSEQFPWEAEEQIQAQARNESEQQTVDLPNRSASKTPPAEHENRAQDDGPDEDELDALLGEGADTQSAQVVTKPSGQREGVSEPDEDELDALMAESDQTSSGTKSLFGGPVQVQSNVMSNKQPSDNFDDDEEAMAAMDW